MKSTAVKKKNGSCIRERFDGFQVSIELVHIILLDWHRGQVWKLLLIGICKRDYILQAIHNRPRVSDDLVDLVDCGNNSSRLSASIVRPKLFGNIVDCVYVLYSFKK